MYLKTWGSFHSSQLSSCLILLFRSLAEITRPVSILVLPRRRQSRHGSTSLPNRFGCASLPIRHGSTSLPNRFGCASLPIRHGSTSLPNRFGCASLPIRHVCAPLPVRNIQPRHGCNFMLARQGRAPQWHSSPRECQESD